MTFNRVQMSRSRRSVEGQKGRNKLARYVQCFGSYLLVLAFFSSDMFFSLKTHAVGVTLCCRNNLIQL